MFILDHKEFTIKRHLNQFNEINELAPEGVFDYRVNFSSYAFVSVDLYVFLLLLKAFIMPQGRGDLGFHLCEIY